MLSKYLKNHVNFIDSVSSWEEAIEQAAQPLLEKKTITSKYIQDMIENVRKNGSYIVIVPGIAMPHARNNGSVLETGVSFLKLKNPVLFPEDKEVNILFVLAAKDNSQHLQLISDLSTILMEEDTLEKFKEVTHENELINLIESVEST